MALPFKTKKSGGIPVSTIVHALVRSGNAARDSGQWNKASTAYAEALALEPALYHIWVQLGHAETMKGERAAAEAAYLRAAEIAPRDADPLLHSGHRRKDAGDLVGAARFYLEAARRDPGHLGAAAELQSTIARILPHARAGLRSILAASLDQDAAPDPPVEAVLLDVSQLVEAVLSARQFSDAGQAEALRIRSLLSTGDAFRPCAHVEGYPRWLAIRPSQLRRILGMEEGGSAEHAATALQIELVFARSITFRPGDRMLSVSTSEAMPNHELFVAAARKAGAIYAGPRSSTVSPDIVIDETYTMDVVAGIRAAGIARSEVPSPAAIELGTPLGMGKGQSGLALRTGTGWMAPDAGGSWTHASGAEIAFVIPEGTGALRVSLLVRGLPTRSGKFRMRSSDGNMVEANIKAGENVWLVARHVQAEDGIVRLNLQSDEAEAIDGRPGAGALSFNASFGIVGLHACGETDVSARTRFVEAVVLGEIRWVEVEES